MNFCIVTPFLKSLSKEQGGIGTHYIELINSIHIHCQTLFVVYVSHEDIDEETKKSLPGNVRYYRVNTIPKNAIAQMVFSNPLGKRLFRFIVNIKVAALLTYLHIKFRIDGVETSNYDYPCLVTVLLLSQIPVAVRISTTREQLLDYGKNKRGFSLQNELEKTMSIRAKIQLTHTRTHASLIADNFGIPLGKIALIPHGTPLQALENKTSPMHDRETVRILYVGRFEPRKGIDLLFKVMPEILRTNPHTNFTLIGDDPKSLYPESELANCESFSEQVNYLGQVSNDELDRAYQNCDFLVAPSLYESFGLIYIEAMARGKAVIGTWAGGIPEVVQHRKTGILVSAGNPEELREAILEMIQNSEQRELFGKNARQWVENKFSIEKTAKQTAMLFSPLPKII